MTKQFTLPKKFEMTSRNFPYYYDSEWITDGRFMIKKTIVKDCFKYCKPTDDTMPDLNRVIPFNPNMKFKKTNRLIDDGFTYLRVFASENSDVEAFFDDDFISHFKIETLFGDSSNDCLNPMINEDKSFVLMPCRAPKKK